MRRNFKLYLDDQEIGIISNGQTIEFDVTRGQHLLKAKVDFHGSADELVELSQYETRAYQLGCSQKNNTAFAVSMSLLTIFFIANSQNNSIYSLPFLVAGLGIFIYYFIIKRNQYLVFQEITEVT